MNNPSTRESENLGLREHVLESEDFIDCECPKNSPKTSTLIILRVQWAQLETRVKTADSEVQKYR